MHSTSYPDATKRPSHTQKAGAMIMSTSPQSTARSGNDHGVAGPEFTSDVGRKRFGFSHEEIDDSTAYYEGQFKLYQRSGDGTLHSPETGAKYVGQFQSDNFHGKGDNVWSDGSRYVGKWMAGQKHGDGTYTSAEGLNYKGQWEDGKRHGQGTQEYANTDSYSGWWYRGLCSGLGTYAFSDGSRYEGAWANGRYDGPGVLYGSNGDRERQWYSGGLLTRREVLPRGEAPTMGSRRALVRGKVEVAQSRKDMHKPTVLPKPHQSRHLIQRDSHGMDLSAPPLLPKCAPAPMSHGVPADRDVDAPAS